jgi:probable phosphoglycerate mutase
MKLYLVRHGQTSWNQQGIAQGRKNIPLNLTGIQQAQELRDKLKAYHFDYCYASPLARARKTAEIITEGHKVEIVYDELLLERSFGDNEGKHGKELRKNGLDIGDLKLNTGADGVEPVKDVLARADKFLAMIKAKHKTDDTILIVGHGTMLKCLHFAIEGYDDDLDFWSWHMQNCEIYEHEI